MTRLIHFSDIHLGLDRPGWKPLDFVSKRVTGWYHLHRGGRALRFAEAPSVVRALGPEFASHSPDAIVFSGDATALGFASEIAFARDALEPLRDVASVCLAVAGNHDHYTLRSRQRASFEKTFRDWQHGDRIRRHRYPFARRVGDVWLIAVNSSKPNFLPHSARGACGRLQRERLRQMLRELPPGHRAILTHYPLSDERDRPEPYWHRLADHRAMLRIAIEGGVTHWLCGHRHRPYVLLPTRDRPLTQVCAGSATQKGLAGYFQIDFGEEVRIVRRDWNETAKEFTKVG